MGLTEPVVGLVAPLGRLKSTRKTYLMMSQTAAPLTEKFLAADGIKRFDSVAEVLSADLVLEWPQSNERIRGAERFARMNREYPALGPGGLRLTD
jgi:hypothetical protein